MVSIIIPAYNCESYVTFTLESIRQQSYFDLEVIIVNDGSKDRTGSICDYYCQKDYRFHVIHQSNKGPGEARNSGLKAATGNYIGFIDAGDYLHSRAIELLVNALDQGSDLVLMGLKVTFSLSEDTCCELGDINIVSITQEQLVNNMISSTGNEMFPWTVVWNKLYRRDTIGNTLFCDLICNEDQEFNLQVYLKSKKIVYIQNSLYYYYQSENSIVRNPETRPKRLITQTLSRYRMLSSLSGWSKSKYKGIMLDYLYRNMLQRRRILNNTNLKDEFYSLARVILKDTFLEYLFNKRIPLRKKIGFIINWNSHI